MSAATQTPAERRSGGFHHEALLYAGTRDFVDSVGGFLRDAVAANEPVMAAVSEDRARLLRDALGAGADEVVFADMAQLGQNPSRILPVWREFVDAHAASGRRVRGVGEPVWPGRSAPELEECALHESLLNSAFPEDPAFWLVCPYDSSALDERSIAAAHATHPFISADGRRVGRADYDDPVGIFTSDLPEPQGVREKIDFFDADLPAVRSLVATHAQDLGLAAGRVGDLVLAVNEVATNSLRHGGGQGLLRLWDDGGELVCEVRDAGRILDPLTGRRRPSGSARGGRGLWMAHQLCDLVQLRSAESGTTVRMRMRMGLDADSVDRGPASAAGISETS